MKFMFTSKSEIEEEHHALTNECLTHEEIQAAEEEKETLANNFDLIGDDEGLNVALNQTPSVTQASSERALGKRRKGGRWVSGADIDLEVLMLWRKLFWLAYLPVNSASIKIQAYSVNMPTIPRCR
jgi:hypothetical protein